ncbi:TIGR03086 family metal-binding protein [Nonomuraea indica]|uniref:TIGR03086 family metal-binding protein n=1 Tax=Nonomuraea indica TaxID=1581193 RepID=UPI000C7A66B0|nr:TIGR03086 family metal-binding protein [Nonomuraea indica]
MHSTDTLDLLDKGLTWTTARIAAVPADALDAATPCGDWDLRSLLDHTVQSMATFADALDGGGATVTGPWDAAMADLAARARLAWRQPGAMDRTYELPFGTMPGPVMASANLLEAVVHGWDISQAGGEAASIPDDLASAVLTFAHAAIGEAQRGDAFGPALGPALDTGATASERLVAYLGRTP